MVLKLIRNSLLATIITFGVVFSGQVHAHGGLALADDLCVLTVGPYTIHFTGYQPLTQDEEFCEDIPEMGKTVIVMDYVNEELRLLETEVRIIRDTGSETNLDDITVFHLPSQVYSTASILIDHTFPAKGKFVGLVTVSGEGEEYVSRFPFSVGEGRATSWITILPIIALIAGGAYFYLRKNKPKKEGSAGS